MAPKTVLDPVLEKRTNLLTKQQRSSKAADFIHGLLNRYLLISSPTRWNSLYDSLTLLSKLLEETPAVMTQIFDELELD